MPRSTGFWTAPEPCHALRIRDACAPHVRLHGPPSAWRLDRSMMISRVPPTFGHRDIHRVLRPNVVWHRRGGNCAPPSSASPRRNYGRSWPSQCTCAYAARMPSGTISLRAALCPLACHAPMALSTHAINHTHPLSSARIPLMFDSNVS